MNLASPILDSTSPTMVWNRFAGAGSRPFRSTLLISIGVKPLLAQAIRNQSVASISFIDTLEHITNGENVLSELRQVAAKSNASLVLSVPNVAHKDLALKLLLGRWDVTEDGLLDHTHVTLYNHSRLSQLMKSVGWCKIATRDWPLQYSDQYFPKSSPLLNEGSPIGRFLLQLIGRANRYAIVNQFVGIYQPSEPQPRPLLEDRVEPSAPFLSVVMTVADPPPPHLRELLRQLADQTSHDFELVILHSVANPEDKIQIELLKCLPILSGRTRLVAAAELSSRVARNAAIDRCSGRYFVILDDAEGIDCDWVRTLAALAEQTPGAALQVQQGFPIGSQGGLDSSVEAVEAISHLLPLIYRIAVGGHGCFATLAIPTVAFHQLGLRFELELPDGKGWDLAVDAALLCGLSVSPAACITALRTGCDSVRRICDLQRAKSLLGRLNSAPILLPSGSAERLEQLARDHAERLEQLARDNCKLRVWVLKLEQLVNERPILRSLIAAFCPSWMNEALELKEDSPFLSVITRTQGQRLYTLRDTLMSLAGQTSQDFEIILVVHSDSEAVNQSVRATVGEFPEILCERISVVTCVRSGRCSPLNDGIELARGRYVAILDDDDIALGNWVETFQQLASEAPAGSLLRSTCTRQDFDITNTGDVPPVPRATSWYTMDWPSTYDPVDHIFTNYTPPMCVAYPIEVFRNDGLRFDENLSTGEDWDFTLRSMMLRGVVTSPEVTAIYRWGAANDVSANVHSHEEWAANQAMVRNKLNAGPILLPAGSASRIASLVQDSHSYSAQIHDLEARLGEYRAQVHNLDSRLGELQQRVGYLATQVISAGGSIPWIDDDPHLVMLSGKVLESDLVTSRSWRVTRPLRQTTRLLTREHRDDLTIDTIPSTASERLHLIGSILQSTSWRFTFPLRVVGSRLRRTLAIAAKR